MTKTPWAARCHYWWYIRDNGCLPSTCPPVELPAINNFIEWYKIHYGITDIVWNTAWQHYHYWGDLQIATYKLTWSMVYLVAPLHFPRLHTGTYLPIDLFRKLMLFLTCSWGNAAT